MKHFPRTRPLLFVACLMALFVCVATLGMASGHCVENAFLSAAALGVGMALSVKDENLSETVALAADDSPVGGSGFDLENSENGEFAAHCEILIEAPALTTGQLADGSTMTYSVYHDTDSAFGTEVLLADAVLVQTGAGGAGAAAATARLKLPSDVSRYVRVKAVNSVSQDASAASFVASLVF